jgi:hypothetical protein
MRPLNCNCLGLVFVARLVILPNELVSFTFVPGPPRLGWFKTLKASPRICNRKRSRMERSAGSGIAEEIGLPVSEDIREKATLQEALSFSERQFIQNVAGKEMRHHEAGRSVFSTQVKRILRQLSARSLLRAEVPARAVVETPGPRVLGRETDPACQAPFDVRLQCMVI